MKRSSFAGALVSVFILTAIVCGSRNMAAQATRPKAQRASSAAKVTPGRGAAFIRIAWRNLARAYQDLLNTPGDVKGDTSRVEGALGAAIDDLHQLDPSFAAASPALGRQDRGKTREYVFEAVQHHLNLAKKAVEDSGIKSNYCEQALGNIATAQAELK